MAKSKTPAKKTSARATPKKKAPAARPQSRAARQAAEEKQWEAQRDLDTLRRADEIRSSQARLRAAQQEAAKTAAALKKAVK
jgi:hypothetical protein